MKHRNHEEQTGLDQIRSRSPMKRTGLTADEVSVQLSMRRTGMSFQRTRVSADRTLMSVIRTSLALISFGFTIFNFFKALNQASNINQGSFHAARNFGLGLLITGIVLLILGLIFHVRFMKALRKERNELIADDMLFGHLPYPVSLTAIIAVALLVIGFISLISIFLRELSFA